jgi:PAS domain S-box-containing protein
VNELQNTAGNTGERALRKVILRLVKGGAERHAIESGQADAILDPATGSAFLLPEAQRWLMGEVHLRRQAGGRQPERRAAGILEGFPGQAGVLDAAGVVLSANQAWREAAATRGCLGTGVAEGGNYLAACDGAGDHDRLDGIALAAGIRQVIAGERTLFRYEHACELPAGRCWFAFSVTAVAGSEPARATVLREDISERKRLELLLRLEGTVARCLAEAGDARTALKTVIQAVCETQGWDCGRYFRLDSTSSVLRCHESWGVPTPAVEKFLERSRGVALRVSAGLKGRVYRSGQPLWLLADSPGSSASPTALAPETDADGAFIFPVTWNNRTIGVLAFSDRRIREPDDRLLQAVRAIGSLLGRFLQRQEALDLLRRSEARFRRLTELSTDWYWEQDRDFRFTEYAGLGVLGADEVLGKRLWELPNIVQDSADWAAHQSQLGERWSFCDFEFTALQPDGQQAHYRISGEPIFDESGAFAGYWGTGLDVTRRKREQAALRESGNGGNGSRDPAEGVSAGVSL